MVQAAPTHAHAHAFLERFYLPSSSLPYWLTPLGIARSCRDMVCVLAEVQGRRRQARLELCHFRLGCERRAHWSTAVAALRLRARSGRSSSSTRTARPPHHTASLTPAAVLAAFAPAAVLAHTLPILAYSTRRQSCRPRPCPVRRPRPRPRLPQICLRPCTRLPQPPHHIWQGPRRRPLRRGTLSPQSCTRTHITHTCVHACTHAHTHACAQQCMCACMHMYMHAFVPCMNMCTCRTQCMRMCPCVGRT